MHANCWWPFSWKVRFHVLAALPVKIAGFWDVTPCILVER
jgi:hypothetical protein